MAEPDEQERDEREQKFGEQLPFPGDEDHDVGDGQSREGQEQHHEESGSGSEEPMPDKAEDFGRDQLKKRL